MKWQLPMILAVGMCLAADDPKDDAAKKELDMLQGTWTTLSIEEDGKALPAEKLKGSEMVIKGDKYTFKLGDMSEEGTLKLDPAKKPKTVDISITSGQDKGKKQLGLYELSAESFKLCVTRPELERPKGIAAKEGSENILFTFKRAKK